MNKMRVHVQAPSIDSTLLKRYEELSAALVSDAATAVNGARVATVGIWPIANCVQARGGGPIVGTAFTVLTRPGDNLAVHRAATDARAGDVIVIDARGDMNWGLIGELVTTYAATRGIGGFVVDGAVRDASAIATGRIAVFARGLSHAGPQKLGPGELHGVVNISGVAVSDGDLVIADEDGVTFVERAQITSVLEASERIAAGEADTRAAIANGSWDRSWIATAAEWDESGAPPAR